MYQSISNNLICFNPKSAFMSNIAIAIEHESELIHPFSFHDHRTSNVETSLCLS